MKIVADTNVLVYSFNKSSGFHQNSRAFLEKEKESIILANQSLFEFLRTVTHPKFPHPLSLSEALNHIADYKDIFGIIYETQDDFSVFQELCLKYKLGSNRIFDTKLAATIIANGITQFATFNEKDFNVFDEFSAFRPQE